MNPLRSCWRNIFFILILGTPSAHGQLACPNDRAVCLPDGDSQLERSERADREIQEAYTRSVYQSIRFQASSSCVQIKREAERVAHYYMSGIEVHSCGSHCTEWRGSPPADTARQLDQSIGAALLYIANETRGTGSAERRFALDLHTDVSTLVGEIEHRGESPDMLYFKVRRISQIIEPLCHSLAQGLPSHRIPRGMTGTSFDNRDHRVYTNEAVIERSADQHYEEFHGRSAE